MSWAVWFELVTIVPDSSRAAGIPVVSVKAATLSVVRSALLAPTPPPCKVVSVAVAVAVKFSVLGSVPVAGAVTAKLRSIVAVWLAFGLRPVSWGTAMWMSPVAEV
ncbi:hypothetical protein ABIF52_007643 [Bradyrhizobium japonicum]